MSDQPAVVLQPPAAQQLVAATTFLRAALAAK